MTKKNSTKRTILLMVLLLSFCLVMAGGQMLILGQTLTLTSEEIVIKSATDLQVALRNGVYMFFGNTENIETLKKLLSFMIIAILPGIFFSKAVSQVISISWKEIEIPRKAILKLLIPLGTLTILMGGLLVTLGTGSLGLPVTVILSIGTIIIVSIESYVSWIHNNCC